MRPARVRGLHGTDDLERDLTDSTTPVFVPAIMGAGLLVSLLILLTDLGRALRPRVSRARREARMQRAAIALVAPAAAAVGVPAPTVPRVRRRLRSRWTYVVVFMATMSLGLYIATGSTGNYLREDGYLEGVLWVFAVSLAVSSSFVALALVALVIAIWYPTPPTWIRSLVDRTPLGARDL